MVMLVGQVERGDFGRLALQEQNYSRLLSDVTKQVIEVDEPEQASEAIARAFHLAESGTPGPVAVILPEDIFDEETEAETDRAAAACRRRAARRGSGTARRDAGEGRAAAGAGRRRADGRRGARQGGAGGPQPARRGMGPADQPDASPAAAVRRDAPELRRLYGHPRAARSDRRDEKGRSDGRARRAHDRHGQPVLHVPEGADAATAVCPCLAGRERGRPGLAPRSRHPGEPARGHQGAAAARGARRRREAQGLGRRAQRDPQKLLAKEWEPTTRRGQFRRDRLRGRQAPGAGRDRDDRRRQFRQLRAPLYRVPPGAGVPVVGGRRDGVGDADGGRRGAAPARARRSSRLSATAAR